MIKTHEKKKKKPLKNNKYAFTKQVANYVKEVQVIMPDPY